MRTLDEIKADIDAGYRAIKAAEATRDAEIDAAKKEIAARHAPIIRSLCDRYRELQREKESALDAAPDHPWTGKRVVKKAWRRDYQDDLGVVEMCRTGTQFADKLSSYSRPVLGTPFVRLLKKDGTPGIRIDRVFNLGGGNERCWHLAEPVQS